MQPSDKDKNDRLKHAASIAGISLALALTALKTFASIYTGSLSVLSSMIDSLSDILGSLITLIAVKFSARPATKNYRYGYGKSESLSALAQAAFIAGSGLFVMYDGFSRLVSPRTIEQTTLGLVIMIISLIATFVLIAFQRYVIKKTGSQAIKADSAHYVVDILTNASIILTLFVVKHLHIDWFDTLIALVIASYLLYNAYKLACDAICTLLDGELDKSIRDKVKKAVLNFPHTKGIHDLRTRDIGGVYTFEFHLELDGNLSLTKAHEYSHNVEGLLLAKFPDAQIIIHQEPAGIKDDRLDNKFK